MSELLKGKRIIKECIIKECMGDSQKCSRWNENDIWNEDIGRTQRTCSWGVESGRFYDSFYTYICEQFEESIEDVLTELDETYCSLMKSL